MILKDPYILVENLFTEQELSNIIGLGEELKPQNAKTYGVREQYRDSHVSWIELGFQTKWLYKKLIDKMKEVNDSNWKFQHQLVEKLQYTRYDTSQHYNWHPDQRTEPYTLQDGDDAMIGLVRKISFSVLLNDDYEGGNFEIEYGLPDSDDRVKTILPKKNLTIFFPSFIMHRVTPVTNGTRRSLVGWVCGQPYQ